MFILPKTYCSYSLQQRNYQYLTEIILPVLVGLAMVLVFSEATDVSYNVRLWARHLAMATIVLQAAEVSYQDDDFNP